MIPQEDKPTVHERLLGAFAATDLSVDLERRTDADFLMALGMAERRVSNEVSAAAMRMQLAGSQADYRAARRSVVELAKRLNAKRNWRLDGPNARSIGELALAHHVFPTCPHCEGRGRIKAEGTPYLSSAICKYCHGSGKRPIQRKYGDHIRAVLEVLERIESLTEFHVRQILR